MNLLEEHGASITEIEGLVHITMGSAEYVRFLSKLPMVKTSVKLRVSSETDVSLLRYLQGERNTSHSIYWSDDLAGFGIRVTKNIKQSWIYFGRVKGVKGAGKDGRSRQVVITIGRPDVFSYAQALDRARQIAETCLLGIDPTVSREFAMTNGIPETGFRRQALGHEKFCTGCQQVKDRTEFYKTKGVIYSQCKSCISAVRKASNASKSTDKPVVPPWAR